MNKIIGGRRHHSECKCKECTDTYVQCKVTKQQGAGKVERVFWANSDKAVQGRQVKIEEDTGVWSEGWTVANVYGQPQPKWLVVHRSHDYTRQRASSDV